MADFSTLRENRNAREKRSYVTSAPSRESRRGNDEKNINDAEVDCDPQKIQLTGTGGPTPLSVDGLYALLPTVLEVRMDSGESGNGRGIYSNHSRKPGDVLLSVKPHVAALSNEHLEECCSSCFATKSLSLRRCTGCKVVLYCDSKCQTADWRLHKHECTAIQTWGTSSSLAKTSGSVPIPGDAIRCLGRMLWRKQKLGPDSVWAREIDAMQSHRKSISRDSGSQDSQMYTQLAHVVVRFLGLNSPQELADYGMNNAADLVDLVSRFTTNTFTISTPTLAPLGACVSPLVALVNHSCDPNAVVVFPRAGGKEEPLMHVIALKHISADEEILTAYVDTTLPRSHRQKVLQETYHFTCQCRLCAPPPNSLPDLREAMWCPKKCGGVCSLPTEENSLTRCSKCKTPVKDTEAVLDAVRVGEEAFHKAEALQFSNPQKAIQLTTKLVPILISAGLVPAAYPLLALCRLNASLLIAHLPYTDPNVEEAHSPEIRASLGYPISQVNNTPQDAQVALDNAVWAATQASTGLAQILTEGHPVRGIALAELGKLLTVDEPQPTHLQEAGKESVANTNTTPQTSSRASSFIINPLLKAPPSYPPSGPHRLKLAYETLVRARAELMIGFGSGKNEGGEVGREVRQLAVDVEKELTVWKSGVRLAFEDRPKSVKK